MQFIALTHGDHVASFCAFLERVNVQVDEVSGGFVRASVPGANTDLHERRELDGYVLTWNALNPGQPATLLPEKNEGV